MKRILILLALTAPIVYLGTAVSLLVHEAVHVVHIWMSGESALDYCLSFPPFRKCLPYAYAYVQSSGPLALHRYSEHVAYLVQFHWLVAYIVMSAKAVLFTKVKYSESKKLG